MKKHIYTLCALASVLGFTTLLQAQMQSDNYSIPTAVLSGGSAPMGSANYDTIATMGQPSPLMDPAYPPASTNFDLYPGFYYTLEAGVVSCQDISSFAASFGLISFGMQCDVDGDGDVDGSDLAEFAAGSE